MAPVDRPGLMAPVGLQKLLEDLSMDTHDASGLLGLEVIRLQRMLAGRVDMTRRLVVFTRLIAVAARHAPAVFARYQTPAVDARALLNELRLIDASLTIDHFAALLGRTYVSAHRWLVADAGEMQGLIARRLVAFVRQMLASVHPDEQKALLAVMVEASLSSDPVAQVKNFVAELREIDPDLSLEAIASLFGRTKFSLQRWLRSTVPPEVLDRIAVFRSTLAGAATKPEKRGILATWQQT